MVHQIIKGRYGIFIESFIIAIIIFLIGFTIGFYFENARLSKVILDYRDNEVDALDLRLQNYYYQIMGREECALAIEQNFIFADKIYLQGLELEKYEEANQISDSLKAEKKRYVLLKTELWLNILLLKEKCNEDFDTIVYFYSSDPSNAAIVSQQKIISNVLKEVKEENGDRVILLPLAGDLDLDIVNLQRNIYGVEQLPSILINEKYLLEGFHSKDEIEKHLSSGY